VKQASSAFLKKSAQKTFAPLRAALAPPKPREAEQKFFCFFFFKKRSSCFLLS
jgi:hypothetical protein